MEWRPVQDSARIHGGNAYVDHVIADTGEHGARKTLKETSFHRYDRFRREVRVAGTLSHEHLCPVIDSYLPAEPSAQAPPYFVMPWHDGGTLHDRVQRREYAGNLPAAAAMLLPIVEACLYMHENGVYHRDIKPKNILFASPACPRLADLGLCYAADDARLTATLEMAGSQLFMAPEYCAGRVAGSDHALADAFSFGKTLWAMLAGRDPLPGPILPYAGTNLMAEFGESCRDAQALTQALTAYEPGARLPLVDLAESLRALRPGASKTADSPRIGGAEVVRLLNRFVETDVLHNEEGRAQAQTIERLKSARNILQSVEVAVRADGDILRLLDEFGRQSGETHDAESSFGFHITSPRLENGTQPGEHVQLASQLGFELPKSVALELVLSPTSRLVQRVPMVIAIWSLAVPDDSPYVEARAYVYSRSNAVGFPCRAATPGIAFKKHIENVALREEFVGSVPRQVAQFLGHVDLVRRTYLTVR